MSTERLDRRPAAERVSAIALTIVATTCAVAALYLARSVVVPLLLALVFALLLAPTVEALARLHVPRVLGAALVLACVLAAITALLDATWAPARGWLDSAPQTVAAIEMKVRPIQLVIRKLDRLGESAQRLAGAHQSPGRGGPAAALSADALSAAAMAVVPGAVATAAMIVALVYLLLTLGPEWIARLQRSRSAGAAHSGVELIRTIRVELSRYLASIALINIGVGLVVALLARVCGLPNPMLWGTLAALLNFVPYFGPACTLLILTLVGLVHLNSLAPVLMLAGGFLGVTFVEGQIIQPLVVGRRLALNPIAVLLGMWLLWSLWGVAGVVLAVPTLLTLKILSTHLAALRALQALIGTTPVCAESPAAAAPAPARGADGKLSLVS